MGVMGFLGYVDCDNCEHFVHFNNPDEIKIWFHPDDPRSLAEVTCPVCGHTTEGRIDFDHMSNLRRRGCVVSELNNKFEPLTEEMIDEWVKQLDTDESELLTLV
jgi:hypothetical protein